MRRENLPERPPQAWVTAYVQSHRNERWRLDRRQDCTLLRGRRWLRRAWEPPRVPRSQPKKPPFRPGAEVPRPRLEHAVDLEFTTSCDDQRPPTPRRASGMKPTSWDRRCEKRRTQGPAWAGREWRWGGGGRIFAAGLF